MIAGKSQNWLDVRLEACAVLSHTNLNIKKCVGLFSSSNLQVTISKVNISVLKERPKMKIRST